MACSSHAILVLSGLCFGVIAYDPVISFQNKAGNSVTLMQECNEVLTVGAGEQDVQVPVPKTGAKFWIKPQGFQYDCKLDCLDCFYISANVAPSGALVTGIGYGHNTPVKVHDGVAAMQLDATREDSKKPDEVKCSTSSCNFNHIIPGFNTRITMSGPSVSVLAATYDPVISFENMAGNSVTLMQECNEVLTVGAGEQNAQVPVPKTGAKFWIKPQGFQYDCKLDCLDCFYISANVAPSGALVTGIGYGHNTPVKVHDGIASMQLDATREDSKKADEVKCSTSSCNFNHIIPGFNTRITMSGPSVSVLAATYDPVISFENMAGNSVTLMQECNEVLTVGAGEQNAQVPVPKTGAKFWIKPQGFKYDCKLDCLDCFYISANVAPSGALVTGIGYGHNTPVKVHDGVASMQLDATREDSKKPDEVKCSASSCNFNHIIPGFDTRITVSGSETIIV